ncbi:MAG: hypothetical protein AAGA75_17540 [Cyanobacteria bacterium P01_E01_bin.6]
MTKTTTTEQVQVDNAQAMTYSIKDAAKQLKRSESSIKNYKRVLLEAWNKEDFKVISDNGSLTEFGLGEMREIMKYAKQGNPDQYISVLWAMHPELSNEQSSDDLISQPVDQVNDYGIVAGKIVVAPPVEVEVNTSEELLECGAISRFQARQGLKTQQNSFKKDLSSLRLGIREMVRQEVSAGVMEGISLGFTEGGETLSEQQPKA